MSIPHLVTERSLTFVVNGTPYQVDRTATQFADIVSELNKGDRASAETLIELADLSRKVIAQVQAAVEAHKNDSNPFVQQYLVKGIINVDRNGVTFNGENIQNALADRLMLVLESGLRLGPWIRFAENVYQNPAEYSRDELMLWLDKADLPITDDGCFLAYKVVRSDFKDLHSGKFDNSPGQVVSLPGRQSVDPNRAKTCSYGLHFCSKDYLPHFGYMGGGNKVVLVKVNPADVVSIPNDYDNTKGRTWRYEVIEEVPAVEIMGKSWTPIATSFSSDYQDAQEYEEPVYEDEPSLEDAVRAARHQAHVESGTQTAGLGITTLRSMAAALKKGNSTWVWKEADVKGLRKFLSDEAANRAEQAVRSGR